MVDLAETDKMNKLCEMFSELNGKIDAVVIQVGELKGQMQVMNGKLTQIAKDTDLKINNLTNKVNKENEEIKSQIKSINQNKVLEEACNALYVHNVDELTGA